MGERYLTIMEVSQKQNYIFSSNKLRDNVINSAVIAWVMSKDYFKQVITEEESFSIEKNYVYSGGGHVVLEFEGREKATEFTKKITLSIRREYPGIEVFASTQQYEQGKNPAENLRNLTACLEKKKSRREAAFHQGTFGIEQIDTNTRHPVISDAEIKTMPSSEKELDDSMIPNDFKPVFQLDKLGGSKNESNFIAVVHIDGNAMGKRVENFGAENKNLTWEAYRRKLRAFSEAIDSDFKDAYRDMTEVVAENIRQGRLEELDLKENNFPIRRIITAGDDICYVTEGRIGIESAVIFLKKLKEKINSVDKEHYSACAGVAVVHQKYPFYKSYELAEALCSNAKRFGASISGDGLGKDISSIDWHLEFGEVGDSLEQIREEYLAEDGKNLSLRPYLVDAKQQLMEENQNRTYRKFRELAEELKQDNLYSRGLIKNLRNVLKQGDVATTYYLKFHCMDALLNKQEELFDAIEVMDTYLTLEETEE
jgi:hypothetical protein